MNAAFRPPASAPPMQWLPGDAALGDGHSLPVAPTPVPAPHWVAISAGCAADLGLPEGWSTREDWQALQVFAGNAVWPGLQTRASVYAGHQFGVWAGQLGDGRALSLGTLDTPRGPAELQLKGAGRTPYSRMGDGRAVLRSSIREFLCSEAMHALGIPTTRALCVVGSPLPVRRERLETAAVLTRAAPSFIRFGHFEHHAHSGQINRLRQLADHVIARHYPDCASGASPYVALLEAVSLRTAALIAQWQAVGFCHGVMNTDNMSILGLTIDYGPFGFLDAFDPAHVCNHSDDAGRYAYDRQPAIGHWNLFALAHALLPLIGDGEAAIAAIAPYKAAFVAAHDVAMRRKLGLGAEVREGDALLVRDWLQLLADGRVDHTIAFRRLAAQAGADQAPVRDLFLDRAGYDAWAARYAERTAGSDAAARRRDQLAANPAIVLRNHLAEAAIRRAEAGDFTEVARLAAALAAPFDDHADEPDLTGFAPEWAQQLEVSCSS